MLQPVSLHTVTVAVFHSSGVTLKLDNLASLFLLHDTTHVTWNFHQLKADGFPLRRGHIDFKGVGVDNHSWCHMYIPVQEEEELKGYL